MANRRLPYQIRFRSIRLPFYLIPAVFFVFVPRSLAPDIYLYEMNLKMDNFRKKIPHFGGFGMKFCILAALYGHRSKIQTDFSRIWGNYFLYTLRIIFFYVYYAQVFTPVFKLFMRSLCEMRFPVLLST